jgi:hypothetical protein
MRIVSHDPRASALRGEVRLVHRLVRELNTNRAEIHRLLHRDLQRTRPASPVGTRVPSASAYNVRGRHECAGD